MGIEARCGVAVNMEPFPSRCVLHCDFFKDTDTCPEGSTCKSPMGPGPGFCTYP